MSDRLHDLNTPVTELAGPDGLGALIRARRQSLGLGLREAAPLLGVGVRFLSELERGKPTAEMGKVFQVLRGLELSLGLVGVPETPEGGFSRLLGTEFPYDWSNTGMDSGTFIRRVLRAGRFEDVLRTVAHFGFDRVGEELGRLENGSQRARVAAMLARIYQGRLMAGLAVEDEDQGALDAS